MNGLRKNYGKKCFKMADKEEIKKLKKKIEDLKEQVEVIKQDRDSFQKQLQSKEEEYNKGDTLLNAIVEAVIERITDDGTFKEKIEEIAREEAENVVDDLSISR